VPVAHREAKASGGPTSHARRLLYFGTPPEPSRQARRSGRGVRTLRDAYRAGRVHSTSIVVHLSLANVAGCRVVRYSGRLGARRIRAGWSGSGRFVSSRATTGGRPGQSGSGRRRGRARSGQASCRRHAPHGFARRLRATQPLGDRRALAAGGLQRVAAVPRRTARARRRGSARGRLPVRPFPPLEQRSGSPSMRRCQAPRRPARSSMRVARRCRPDESAPIPGRAGAFSEPCAHAVDAPCLHRTSILHRTVHLPLACYRGESCGAMRSRWTQFSGRA